MAHPQQKNFPEILIARDRFRHDPAPETGEREQPLAKWKRGEHTMRTKTNIKAGCRKAGEKPVEY